MTNTPPTFTPVFLTLFSGLEQMEKHSKKYFRQLRSAAFSPELSKALHGEQTGIDDHIKRLKLIQTELPKNNKKNIIDMVPLHLEGYGRKKAQTRDLYLISLAQQLLQSKNVYYRLLQRLAIALDLADPVILLKQTISENDATHTWLDRIAQRIISGESLVLEFPS